MISRLFRRALAKLDHLGCQKIDFAMIESTTFKLLNTSKQDISNNSQSGLWWVVNIAGYSQHHIGLSMLLWEDQSFNACWLGGRNNHTS